MSYGINVIQVGPLFCLDKIRRCKASNLLDGLRCVYAIYTALACFKHATWLKLITTMQEKTMFFSLFSLMKFRPPLPLK